MCAGPQLMLAAYSRGDYCQMGLCLRPEVPDWALIRLRGEKKPEATEFELQGHVNFHRGVV